MSLSAHCARPGGACGHHRGIDLDDLIAKLGEDYVYINDKRIGAMMVCQACGYKGAQIMVVADTRPWNFKKV